MKNKFYRLLGILFALVILQKVGFAITTLDCSNPEKAEITLHEEGNEQDYGTAPQCEEDIIELLDD